MCLSKTCYCYYCRACEAMLASSLLSSVKAHKVLHSTFIVFRDTVIIHTLNETYVIYFILCN